MEILATRDGSFVIMAMTGLDAEWAVDGSLLILGDRPRFLVSTSRGVFVEALNEAGEVIRESGDGEPLCIERETDGQVRLRHKKLADPGLTAEAIAKARQSVTRILLSDKPYCLDIPDTLPGAIEWMQKQLASIPEASRAAARFSFDTTSEYGETYPNIQIEYSEPETDEEVVLRIQVERERARLANKAKRQQLKRLQAELETD